MDWPDKVQIISTDGHLLKFIPYKTFINKKKFQDIRELTSINDHQKLIK